MPGLLVELPVLYAYMVASAEFDPVTVDAHFTPARLGELLAFARESAKLDYKRQFDPSSNQHTLELTKDLVAMANTAGGYVCIGVEDDGTIVGAAPAELARLDEAVIRAKVRHYIGTSIELYVNASVEIDGKQFGVITVLRSPRSPIVFERLGQYSYVGGKSTKIVFSPGDVFVRHGSASERWNQDDVDSLYARVVEREKEKWLRGVMPDIKRIVAALAAGEGADSHPEPRELVVQDASSFEKLARLIARSIIP